MVRAHVLYSVLVTRFAYCRTRHSSTQTQLEAELRDALDALRTNQAASGENETRSRSREEALRRELTQLQLVCSCTRTVQYVCLIVGVLINTVRVLVNTVQVRCW